MIRAALLLAALMAAGCVVRPLEISDPTGGEKTDDTYLNQGATTRIETGPDGKGLLEALTEERGKVASMTRELDELRSRNSSLEVKNADLESQLERERKARLSAKAQHEVAQEKLRDRDGRVLDLSIEKANLEQEVLQLKIAAARGAAKPATGR